MKVYAIASPHPVRLGEMKLYLHKISANAAAAKMQATLKVQIENKNQALRDQKSELFYGYYGNEYNVVEIEVDEYPTFAELRTWLGTLTTQENVSQIMDALQCAERLGVGYEVLLHAFEQQDEPDFDVVKALDDACFRWDV